MSANTQFIVITTTNAQWNRARLYGVTMEEVASPSWFPSIRINL